MNSISLAESIQRVLRGDVNAIAHVCSVDHASLQEAEATIGEPLIVERAAAVSVLRGMLEGRFPPMAVQAWASFVRRGYVAGSQAGPIRPIDIEYADTWEDAIVEAISRLDEIGDEIDGEVSAGEVEDLLMLLGDP